MKKQFRILCGLLFTLTTVQAQQLYDISFADTLKPITRNKETDQIFKIKFKTQVLKKEDVKGFTLNLKADMATSSLSGPNYELDFKPVLLTDLKEDYTCYLTIKKDPSTDRQRELILKLFITDDKGKEDKDENNKKDNLTKLTLKVNGINEELGNYNNLAYIGTNFDLVDGPKAKNLFFAINIFQSPLNDTAHKIGFNITLYGNRAFTNSYNNGIIRYTSKIVGKGNNTAMQYESEGEQTIDRTTDNLGAAFYPMYKLFAKKNVDGLFDFFYAPQAEFIWRRTAVITTYKNSTIVDSTLLMNRPITGTITLTPTTQTTPINIYDVNIGFLGFLLKHQTSHISVRLNAAFGANISYSSASYNTNVTRILTSNFTRTTNWFFSSKLWITEPVSGITIGAEIYNNMFQNPQPYYNVTLSKAIDFGNLGKIFSPITAR
jgi:hypothetical protein